jgi:hypothetical protein
MISQERFEELVKLARKGQLETMEAIKLAVHESIADEQAKNAELLTAARLALPLMENFFRAKEGKGTIKMLRNAITKAEGNADFGRVCSCVECVPNGPDGPDETETNAKRYEWLRSRDLEQISLGGVFAGMTPDNTVLNGVDLDNAIDAEMAGTKGEQL